VEAFSTCYKWRNQKITLKQVQKFMGGRVENNNWRKQRAGINSLQLDIFVLKMYETSNYWYGYILCIMDVFSRKAWCYPLKTKGLSDTTPTIKKFFSESRLHKFNKEALVLIMSDSYTAFKGVYRNEEQIIQKFSVILMQC
jgi:hypothetical protein